MKKLVFNFQFYLLITMFIFVAMPAMAIVEVSLFGTVTGDDPNTPENERSATAKLTYSKLTDSGEVNPKPTVDTINSLPTTIDVTVDGGTDSDPKTYFIRWTNFGAGAQINFTLQGYKKIFMGASGGNLVFYDWDGSAYVVTSKLVLLDNHLPGLGYAIYARNDTDIADEVYPTLPTLAAPNTIVKKAWAAMPESPHPIHRRWFT